MNNYIILKWGSLKAYNFTEEFVKENEEIVKELNDIWDIIYSERLGAMSGSEYLQSKEELKQRLVNVLEKFFEFGVVFQNGFTDEYYNNFNEIKDYIMSYGG